MKTTMKLMLLGAAAMAATGTNIFGYRSWSGDKYHRYCENGEVHKETYFIDTGDWEACHKFCEAKGCPAGKAGASNDGSLCTCKFPKTKTNDKSVNNAGQVDENRVRFDTGSGGNGWRKCKSFCKENGKPASMNDDWECSCALTECPHGG